MLVLSFLLLLLVFPHVLKKVLSRRFLFGKKTFGSNGTLQGLVWRALPWCSCRWANSARSFFPHRSSSSHLPSSSTSRRPNRFGIISFHYPRRRLLHRRSLLSSSSDFVVVVVVVIQVVLLLSSWSSSSLLLFGAAAWRLIVVLLACCNMCGWKNR